MLNKEKIFNIFRLPIEFNSFAEKTSKNIKQDLELTNSLDPKVEPIYSNLFNMKTNFDKMSIDKWSNLYTKDKTFIKDTQLFLKNCNDLGVQQHKIDTMINIWEKINKETSFLETYQFIEWERFKYLNNSKLILSVLSFYNISSPLFQLISPLLIFITPFILMKSLGVAITAERYTEILWMNLQNQPMYKLFFSFNTMNLGQQIYGTLMVGLWIYNVYSNIVSCYKFYKQMLMISDEFDKVKSYLDYTIENMKFILTKTANLKSYNGFNENLYLFKDRLEHFRNEIKTIPKTVFTPKNIIQIGTVMKYYFTLWDSSEVEEIFMYSFGFNCFYNNLKGVNDNIQKEYINKCKLTNKKKIKFENVYHPSIKSKVIKNNVNLSKNKIITGPNAAGKTTILKAITISLLTSQQIGYGYYKNLYLNPYDYFHCYINIPDSNNRDSLFQSEARRCKEILDIIKNNKNKRHFCLFDELYSGTNPYEAIGSAYSYLNYISKNKNLTFILTTHFIKLCNLLDKNKYIQNINMKTDIINNSPKYYYKIKKGISKIKGGVHVLKQLDYPPLLIQEAKQIIEKIE
jgi:hypothetical protein